jgi:hypothetical protein
MMKVYSFIFLLLFALAQSVGAQTVSQPLTVSWQYSGSTQTGFRIERMAPGGSFTVIATVKPEIREYVDNVSGSPGDIFNYRIVAFNATQISGYSPTATGTIAIVTTQPPQAPTVTVVVRNKNQCSFTLTGMPPDVLGGWTVQYKYSGTNFGLADGSEPFVVTSNLKAGSYDFFGTWTKPGQPTLNSGHVAGRCP